MEPQLTMYADRKPWELEPHYSLHMMAMTTERLESKSAIAEELAFRDQKIAQLEAEILTWKNQVRIMQGDAP